MQTVILSKDRAQSIKKNTLRYFPKALLCVAQEERDTYAAAAPGSPLLLHPDPDQLCGMAAIRQWTLDTLDEECVIFADDDITGCSFLDGYDTRLHRDPDVCKAIVENAAEMAYGSGAALFGFAPLKDPKGFVPQDPFRFSYGIGGVYGVIGRETRFDTTLQFHEEIDFTLQNLIDHRVVFTDTRWTFETSKPGTPGGNSAYRTEAAIKAEIAYLREKWGKYLEYTSQRGAYALNVKVRRRSKIAGL